MGKRWISLAALATGLTLASGCGASTAQNPAAEPHPQAPEKTSSQPQVITDLSTLSPINTIGRLSSRSQIAPGLPPASTVGANPTQSEIERFYLSSAGAAQYSDRTPSPGDLQLLNAKAHHFAEFSYTLLNQTLQAARQLEPAQLQGRSIPDDLKPVILTAVMTSEGKLTEIVIDQHSGIQPVDRLFIEASKTGIWSRNPPAGIASSDGKLRVRIQGVLTNYKQPRNGRFIYTTHLGLSIL